MAILDDILSALESIQLIQEDILALLTDSGTVLPPEEEIPTLPEEGGEGGGGAAQQVRVPNVVGIKVEAAKQVLRDRGLTFSTERIASSQKQDLVVRQRPVRGEMVRPGREVHLWVSRGPK
jgi:hypothetical protein